MRTSKINKIIALVIIAIVLTLSTVTTILIAEQLASEPVTAVCPSPCCLDIVFALDVSGSMAGTPLNYLKEAMHIFINRTCPDGGFAIGLVAFASEATNLTTYDDLGVLWLVNNDTVKKDLNDTIDGLTAGGTTAMDLGVYSAVRMLQEGILNKTNKSL